MKDCDAMAETRGRWTGAARLAATSERRVVGSLLIGCLAVAVPGALACGGETRAASGADAFIPGTTSSVGVTQGGAQDIALFRDIVARGAIPAPETLDDVGFFAEHAMELPAADCGQPVCFHPMLAVAPRFNGDNWTMAFVAMNTAVDPSTVERPPVHQILVLERTLRTAALWGDDINRAINNIALSLRDEDRLSIVAYGSAAEAIVEFSPRGDRTVGDALAAQSREPVVDSTASLYAALAEASTLAGAHASHRARALLLTTGHADAGIASTERIVGLGEALARGGIAVSVVGIGGDDFEDRIPNRLAAIGAGGYYYATGPEDMKNIFRIEGETALIPLATDLTLDLEAAAGYRIGRIYGVRNASAQSVVASLKAPALFVGYREGVSDVSLGRRGGGGGLFVELIADRDAGIGAGAPAFSIAGRYEDGTTAEAQTLSLETTNPLAPGENPREMWPEFSRPDYAKPFMMLNMYLALRAAVQLYHEGDCARAKGVIDMMAPSVELWQGRFDDPDIDADYELLLDLRDNLQDACEATDPIEPIQFSGGCMYS